MKIRVAIAGASGTGKTTLARAISEKFGLPINPIGARSIAAEMGFDNPYDVDAAGKRVEFKKRLFEGKRDWELTHDAFVTDRSHLDNLTYCALHMAEHLEDGAMDQYLKAMNRYHLVFFLPMRSMQVLDDGVRKKNLEYHRLYEKLVWTFVHASDGLAIRALPNLEMRQGEAFARIEDFLAGTQGSGFLTA